MITYLHIGLPKCGSTWFQTRFFPVHPELHHLGKAQRPLDLPFDIRSFLFSDLVDLPDYLFDLPARRRMMANYRSQAATKGRRATGISMELLTNMVVGRMSLDERARRVIDVTGEDTRVIFFVRSQLEWMTSLYTTFVREGGLTLDFADWCFHACFERDVSFYANFLYDRIHESYAARVGAGNILTLPYESFAAAPQAAADAICDFLGGSHLETPGLGKLHARPSATALGAMLALNRKWRFALGGEPFRRPGGHRLIETYAQEGVAPPRYLQDWQQMHALMYRSEDEIIARARSEGLEPEPLGLDCPAPVKEALAIRLAPHNRRLEALTGLDLSALGYWT